MAVLKLYLLLVAKDEPVQVSVHRDLGTLENTWVDCDQAGTVGVVHIGFIRPKIRNSDALLKHRGKLLVSLAVKWSLPEGYKSSVAVIAELILSSQTIPLHQLIHGLGCDSAEPKSSFEVSVGGASSESTLTIVEAALQVLNCSNKPLNKEEVFARIIEGGLYQFGAKKPVSVLGVELNRHSRGTDYSNPATEPLFQKNAEDRYCSLTNESTELDGWVRNLVDDDPELGKMAGSYGIFSEEGYAKNAQFLSRMLRDQLDIYRFIFLSNSIDMGDPQSLIKILPESILLADTRSLDMPIRVQNVLSIRGTKCLSDLIGISTTDMLRWPNFGRKSVGDFCDSVTKAVGKLAGQIASGQSGRSNNDFPINPDEKFQPDEEYKIELASAKSLKTHYQETLSRLKDKDRQIMECRTGFNGEVMTLESVGELVGVTRERIRQIQKKNVEKIIETEYWDDCIAIKIGQLLVERDSPLYVEMLEVEDTWFAGFMGNYQHLAAIIELFSENEIRVIKISGATIVTRIKMDAWDELVSHLRKSLKDKAADANWSRQDIEMTFASTLLENSSAELLPLLWEEFNDTLQFDAEGAEAKLIGFGKSADSAVAAVLSKAEKPLHYSEIAERASKIYGKEVNERLAHNALPRLGAKLYGRGIYGLPHHNPISDRMCKNLQLVVSRMIQDGPLMRQWHCAGIITKLKEQFTALPEELDHYILDIILEGVDNITYLNRMVWARTDSGQSRDDRVDMADAFTKILEDNGGPLKGKELKSRLRVIRGVNENLQIQPSERMIQVGPDYWGLIDRDVGGTEASNNERLNVLFQCLEERQKGIHASELKHFVAVSDDSKELPSAYSLLNLAQRDERFHLGRSMFVDLDLWGDTRRLNTCQAVRRVLDEMTKPMSRAEISMRVEDLLEMPVDTTLSNVLISEGATYDQELKVWCK